MTTTPVPISTSLRSALDALGATRRELAAAMGRDAGTIQGYLEQERVLPQTLAAIVAGLNEIAERRGMEERWTAALLLRGELPGERLTPPPADVVRWPSGAQALGEVIVVPYLTGSCGGAGDPVPDEPSEWAEVRASLAGPGATRDNVGVIRVVGESMSGAGIEPGDELVVRTDLTPRGGDVVCYRANGGGLACGRLDREGRRIISEHADRRVVADVELLGRVQLVGVAVGLHKRLRRWT